MGCSESRPGTSKPASTTNVNPFCQLEVTRADKLIRKFAQTEIMNFDQFNAATEALGLPAINIKDCLILSFAVVPGGVSRNGVLVAMIMSGRAPSLDVRLRLLFDIADDQCEGQVTKEKLRMLIALMIKVSVPTSRDGRADNISQILDIDDGTLDALTLCALNFVMTSWTEIVISFKDFSRMMTTDALSNISTIDGMRHYLTTGFDIRQIKRTRRGSLISMGNVTPSKANKLATFNQLQVTQRRFSATSSK